MASIDRHMRHLLDQTDVEGLAAADIGCGNGAVVRALAVLGARVTGIEIDADKVAAADRLPKAGQEDYREGRGEALPFGDGALDLASFVFSLHHVPDAVRPAAIDEVSRVLRPGGRLHIVDPLAEGDLSEVLRPVEDETAVREAAQALARSLDGQGYRLIAEQVYEIDRPFESAERYIEQIVMTVPERAANAEAARPEVENRFARLSRPDGQGRYWLSQPCVMFHLEKQGG
jgi:hypothetical protein